MARFSPEPPYLHGSAHRTAILLVNLGTPAAPTPAALRTYLKQFLSDPRVVEIPRLVWWLILNGIILNVRPAKSAAKYAAVWTKDGSPLKVNTEAQAKLLQGWLGSSGMDGEQALRVDWAMRYGQPSVEAALDRLKAEGVERTLILPLYPQFAASTTASVFDAVADWLKRIRYPMELRLVRNYHDDPAYIAALAATVREHWAAHGRPDQLVMSFHGLPKYTLTKGDPYFCQCQKTGRLLAEALNLPPSEYRITFQSRFGKAEWLQPYTQPTLETLAREGTQRVDVICPGFVADCLETLEEIAMECKTAFLDNGGREFHYIPCLNQRPDWIAALGGIARQHLGGWPLAEHRDPTAAARAKALGAPS
jgi:ferrochelatase